MPKQGDIATCGLGEPGLITSSEPLPIQYNDGTEGVAWTGIHLKAPRQGEFWCSRNPTVVTDIFEVLALTQTIAEPNPTDPPVVPMLRARVHESDDWAWWRAVHDGWEIMSEPQVTANRFFSNGYRVAEVDRKLSHPECLHRFNYQQERYGERSTFGAAVA